jgi:hypothetical protein
VNRRRRPLLIRAATAAQAASFTGSTGACFGDCRQSLVRIGDPDQCIPVDRIGRKICLATRVLGALTPTRRIIFKWRWRIHAMPIYDATMSLPSVNKVFTRAALVILQNFTRLRTVGKEFVPFGDKKHDPPRLRVGHTGGDGACFRF